MSRGSGPSRNTRIGLQKVQDYVNNSKFNNVEIDEVQKFSQQNFNNIEVDEYDSRHNSKSKRTNADGVKCTTTLDIIKKYQPFQQKAWRRIQYNPKREEQVSPIFTREVVLDILWRLYRQIRTLLLFGYVDFSEVELLEELTKYHQQRLQRQPQPKHSSVKNFGSNNNAPKEETTSDQKEYAKILRNSLISDTVTHSLFEIVIDLFTGVVLKSD